jgi:protein SCO1
VRAKTAIPYTGINFLQRLLGVAVLFLLAIGDLSASQKYDVAGLLLKVDPERRIMVVSCKEIPGYMEAMAMPFSVHDAKLLEGLEPGMIVEFSLIVDKDLSFAENIHVRPFESLELDPAEARRFKLMEKSMAGSSPGTSNKNSTAATDVLHIGQIVPDFVLTDQNRQRVSLSQFKDKVVAVTFIYTRCPLPNYCVRLSNNLGLLQRRFKSRMGEDLILLTIMIDPVHDQPEGLANYAHTWKADGRTWRFLTGPLADIQQLCRKFDMDFYPDEALLVHSFHTVVIDRHGRLAANLEGNDFSAQQLGDLVETVMTRSQSLP